MVEQLLCYCYYDVQQEKQLWWHNAVVGCSHVHPCSRIEWTVGDRRCLVEEGSSSGSSSYSSSNFPDRYRVRMTASGSLINLHGQPSEVSHGAAYLPISPGRHRRALHLKP